MPAMPICPGEFPAAAFLLCYIDSVNSSLPRCI
jgi:hypothetical protein